jgi:hypothetical protein
MLTDDYRPNKFALSNSEVRATGILCGGAVQDIARELIEARSELAALEAGATVTYEVDWSFYGERRSEQIQVFQSESLMRRWIALQGNKITVHECKHVITRERILSPTEHATLLSGPPLTEEEIERAKQIARERKHAAERPADKNGVRDE